MHCNRTPTRYQAPSLLIASPSFHCTSDQNIESTITKFPVKVWQLSTGSISAVNLRSMCELSCEMVRLILIAVYARFVSGRFASVLDQRLSGALRAHPHKLREDPQITVHCRLMMPPQGLHDLSKFPDLNARLNQSFTARNAPRRTKRTIAVGSRPTSNPTGKTRRIIADFIEWRIVSCYASPAMSLTSRG